MSCGVGCRRGSDPEVLWRWRRLVATAPIRPLAWEPPYAIGTAQEMAKRPKKKKKGQQITREDNKRGREEKDPNFQPPKINKMAISTYLYVIIFINGLNAPTKRHKLAERIQKQDPYICCLQETHFRYKNTYRLKVRG